MSQVFFWIAWFSISCWALRTFYFSFGEQKLRRLRDAAIGIDVGVLLLSFLPWVPPTLGQYSGINLAFAGNWFIAAHIIVLLISLVLLVLNQKRYFKWAAAFGCSALFVLFAGLYILRPATFRLTMYDVVPILAFLSLLVNSVVMLLLWQQVQLQEKKSQKKTVSFPTLLVIGVAIVSIGMVFSFAYQQKKALRVNSEVSTTGKEQIFITAVAQLPDVKEFKQAVEDGGRSQFGIAVDSYPTAQEPWYVVVVFEVFPDHRTVFNRYRIDPTTHAISGYDVVNDSWQPF